VSAAPRQLVADFLPDNAPFTPDQRAWLNGLFAGLTALDDGSIKALSPDESAGLMTLPASIENDDEAPWHDQTLSLADRMKLAEGKPLPSRMMAAMAQQDCGQCGYDCKNYSAAIFQGKEARLNLCVPGGKETAPC